MTTKAESTAAVMSNPLCSGENLENQLVCGGDGCGGEPLGGGPMDPGVEADSP